jgi:hypothetical protein
VGEVEVVVRPCEVCSAPVMMQRGSEEPVLCIDHYFLGDPTEEWERD